MEFVSCTRLARDGSYRLHGVNSISFFLAIFLQVLKWSEERKREEKSKNVFVDMSSILDPYEECSAPRTVLIEGEPGMRKTTYCKKYAYD